MPNEVTKNDNGDANKDLSKPISPSSGQPKGHHDEQEWEHRDEMPAAELGEAVGPDEQHRRGDDSG